MADIGPTLREARMRDGRDISEIEQVTKIRAKYLRALENEEWALLPGPTFTKGFLRSYAECLGLDARTLIDEYKRQWEEPHELDVAVRPTIGGEARDGGDGGGEWWRSRWTGAAVLIVALAIAVLLIGTGAREETCALGATVVREHGSGQGPDRSGEKHRAQRYEHRELREGQGRRGSGRLRVTACRADRGRLRLPAW